MTQARILIVEDELMVSRDLAKRLRRAGYEVAGEAASAVEALRQVEERQPDLVLMDIVLDGDMDGIDAATLINTRFNVPVVYLTAHAEEHLFERAKKTKPQGYLTKPVTQRELQRTMEMALYKNKMEQKLRKNQERLELALRGADLSLWDCNLLTGEVFVDRTWTERLGYSLDEIEPRIEFWSRLIHPDDVHLVQRRWNSHIEGIDSLYESEFRIRTKAGDWRWFLVRGKVVQQDGKGNPIRIAGTHLDITERKQAEEALRESEERFRQLTENIDAIFCLSSVQEPHHVMYVSPVYEKVFGRPRAELYHNRRVWQESIHKEDREKVIHSWNEFLGHGAEYKTEYRILRPDGLVRWVRDSAFPIKGPDGKIVRIARLAYDATKRKLDEEKQEELNDELKYFAGIISHDLRAPLANIKGYCRELQSAMELIRPVLEVGLSQLPGPQRAEFEAIIDEDIPEDLAYIDSSTSRMGNLVNAILKLSRFGRRELHFEPLDMNTLVDEVLKSMAYDITSRGIRVIVGSLPETVADRTAMEQIMTNLLANAIKYSDPERPQEIRVAGYSFPDETMFVLGDEGRGIDEADISRVFQIFQRAGFQDVPGEGMGLTYVRTLVRRHGGRIWCESMPGVGSTFTFTIANNIEEATSDSSA